MYFKHRAYMGMGFIYFAKRMIECMRGAMLHLIVFIPSSRHIILDSVCVKKGWRIIENNYVYFHVSSKRAL